MSSSEGGGAAPAPDVQSVNGTAPDPAHTKRARATSARVQADEEAEILDRAKAGMKTAKEHADGQIANAKAHVDAQTDRLKSAEQLASRLEREADEAGE